jgi:hypothetical protein
LVEESETNFSAAEHHEGERQGETYRRGTMSARLLFAFAFAFSFRSLSLDPKLKKCS